MKVASTLYTWSRRVEKSFLETDMSKRKAFLMLIFGSFSLVTLQEDPLIVKTYLYAKMFSAPLFLNING